MDLSYFIVSIINFIKNEYYCIKEYNSLWKKTQKRFIEEEEFFKKLQFQHHRSTELKETSFILKLINLFEDFLSHLTTAKHKTKNKLQEVFRGYSDADIWNLDLAFLYWIHPKLKKLKEIKHGVPGTITPKHTDFLKEKDENDKEETQEILNLLEGDRKYDEILDEMIDCFNPKDYDCYETEKVKRGLYLFTKYFDSLWD